MFHSPGDLPSPTLHLDSLPAELQGKDKTYKNKNPYVFQYKLLTLNSLKVKTRTRR